MRVEHKGDLASLRPLADSKNELGRTVYTRSVLGNRQ